MLRRCLVIRLVFLCIILLEYLGILSSSGIGYLPLLRLA
jgi:hypothetical protein